VFHFDGMCQVVKAIVERLRREAPPEHYQRLLTATCVLTGLRLDLNELRALYKGVPTMQESLTYQAILEEGRVEGLQRAVLHLGRSKLGEPDELTRCALADITDLDRLERLLDRARDVSTWPELLQTP
jgi:hypothetical protein